MQLYAGTNRTPVIYPKSNEETQETLVKLSGPNREILRKEVLYEGRQSCRQAGQLCVDNNRWSRTVQSKVSPKPAISSAV